jgi:hypothetical protein
MLIPTIPAWTSFWNFRAAAPLAVKMAVPLPYGLSEISLMAWSMSSTRSTIRTGPKTSSL